LSQKIELKTFLAILWKKIQAVAVRPREFTSKEISNP